MAQSQNTVFLAGYYGFENAGDEAILRCIVEHLRALRPGLDIVVASENPRQTASRHSVRAVAWKDLESIRGAIAQCGLVLVGGGGLFHDYWGVDPDAFLTERHGGPVYFAGPAMLAALLGKPLMLYAVGIGPLISEHGRAFTKAACDAANTITVRDPASKALLESLGVEGGKIAVTADPAFAFTPAAAAPATGQRPVLGVSLRPWAIGAFPDFWEREVAAALDVFLEEHGGSIMFLPFQALEGAREDDRALSRRVRSCMRRRESAHIAEDSSPEAVYAAIGQCDVVVGMRLHALVFAFLNRRPFVALSYDPKIGEFLRAVGVEGLSADITAVDAQRLAALIDGALARRDEFGAQLDGLRGDFANLARESACAAIKLLDSPVPARMAQSAAPLLARSWSILQSENAALRGQVPELEAARTAAVNDYQEAAAHLHSARKLLGETAAGLPAYRAQMSAALGTYRSQRAWTAMLAVRKAYSLLVRESKIEFAKWLVRLPWAGPGPLETYELTFPDVAEYVPAAMLERSGSAVPAIPRQRKYDLIVFAIIDFDFRFQRPQQIAAQYARDGHRVFWISPTRFLPPASREPYQTKPLRESLWEVHLRGQQPDIYLGRLNADLVASMAEGLRRLCRDWAVADNVVLVQLPFWRQAAVRLREDRGCPVVYDCMDEWATFPNMGEFNVSEERALVREADVLVVSGRTLLEKFQAEELRPVLARNGVDFEFYSQPHGPAGDVPSGRPVIGYFGAIADWLDIELVRSAAVARPQYSFVMVGQVFRKDIARLDLPNVYLSGGKPYEEIPSYLERFDVCVIPFVLNEVTKATDPVKLYEYLARGKPVVATAMAELAGCADLIYIARDAEDYTAQLDRAVAENDPALRERRVAYAAANTWKQRCQTIDAAIRETFPLVSIVIVTHNSVEFVRPCLESIAEETSYPNYEVIVVDNASSDGTVEAIRAYPRFQLQASAVNAGFAAANNAGARAASGEYLVLLNSDTIVSSGWLGRLLRHLQRNPAVGLVCPVTNFAGNEAMIDTDYLSAGQMQNFAQDQARMNEGRLLDLDVAPLYCAMLRRELWNELGGLDERFGVGMFEDDDLSLQVRKRGLRVAAAEDCFVHHFGQGSFAKLARDKYEKVFSDNRRKFEEKWKTAWKPHRTRPNVRPAFERVRFQPGTFCEHTVDPNGHVHS